MNIEIEFDDKPDDDDLGDRDLFQIIEKEFSLISSSLVINLLKAERKALEEWIRSAYPSYTKDLACDRIIELLDESIVHVLEEIITKRLRLAKTVAEKEIEA